MQCRPHDTRLTRVDRKRYPTCGAFRRNHFDDWHHAIELFRFRDVDRPGAGRLAAYIENIGAVGQQRPCMLYRASNIDETSTIGKRIGRDIHDAHDPWAVQQQSMWSAEENATLRMIRSRHHCAASFVPSKPRTSASRGRGATAP